MIGDWLSPGEMAAVHLSLKVAALATLISLPPGIFVAVLLARGRFFGRIVLDIIVHLPLVMPPVVTGYLLLMAFGRQGLIGSWLDRWFGVVLAFDWTGAVLAAGVMGFPLLVRAIRLSVEAVDVRLEQAASTLGASRAVVFVTITLPLICPGILAGTILGFAKSMGEFGATITFVSNIPGITQTIPSAIYAFTQVPGGEEAAIRLIVISIIISAGAIFLSEALGHFVRRRLQA